MASYEVKDGIYYIGVNDHDIELFENQYIVPNGVSYNSYVIVDEKVTVMDTVDHRKVSEWLENLKEVLNDKAVDYLVIQHMEPDHAGSIQELVELYPDMKLVGNLKTFMYLAQFYDFDFNDKKVVVKEGDTLELGKHTLTFVMAPMVHWPEVMVSYDAYSKVLFSADGFGKFGALDVEEDWDCEARRYYFNIVGKYGAQVQALLKKASTLDIEAILPLHGPLLTSDLGHYLGQYNTWSSYEPEVKGIFVAYASIHGNTKDAALKLVDMLKETGVKVSSADLSYDDMAECIEDAFKYDRVVLACATYDGGLFPVMDDFLRHLKAKNYQKRTIGLVENGTWAPMAAKLMKDTLATMKDITVLPTTVTIKSKMNDATIEQMKQLVCELTGE